PGGANAGTLDVLRRIMDPPKRPPTTESCDLCGEEVPDHHGHLVDLDHRNLACACRPCYLLFTQRGAGRYRAVPERYLALDGPAFSQGQWDGLGIPVGVAFFFFNSSLGRVAAFYPGPAGATESLLDLGVWEQLMSDHPVLAGMEPDTEALLVRADRSGVEGYLVPIDACYELVGQMRFGWRGFDGGSEVHQAIEAFFERVSAQAGGHG
ncbi:MAG: DUF5947 family protein, partial [Acidimicrobiales bacterium]